MAEGLWGYFERSHVIGFLERNKLGLGEHATLEHVWNWLAQDCAPVRTIGG